MSEIKLYDTEARMELVMNSGTRHYTAHVNHMTTEDLRSKSGIAVELAWRDLRIEQLIAQLEAAQGSIKELESKVNHYVAAEYAHKHFDQTAEIIKRADSAELELVKVKAELLAAQKERDGLREKVNQADSEWHKMADRILSAGKRAEKAEAALKGSLGSMKDWEIDHSTDVPILVYKKCSVIESEQAYGLLNLIKQSELKGEQVPVAVIVLSKNWPDTGSKVIDYYIEKIQHLPVGTELFTAPQKPVVLSSSTVMSRAYVVQAIKAAGFTVEGE